MATLSEAWNLYHSTILSNATTRSIVTETGRWDNYIVPLIGKDDLDQITALDIVKLRSYLQKRKLSPQSVYHCLSLLRRVFNRAKEWDLFAGEIPPFDMPRFDNKRIRFLSPDEVQVLLDYLQWKNPDWHDIAVVGLYTGLRAGEIFKLTPSDVQLEKRFITVLDTKNKANRVVPLNDFSQSALEKNLRRHRPSSPIFPQLACKTFSRAVEACGFNTGVTDRRHRVVFHTLRHTFASWLVQGGVPIALVSQLLGHKDLKMTMRYSHLAPQQAHEAVAYLATIKPGIHNLKAQDSDTTAALL